MNSIKASLTYIAIIFLLGYSSSSCNQTSPTEKSQTTNQIKTSPIAHNDLPDMAITTLDGRNVRIKEQTGKIVLVLFQPDCDDCQREAVQIQEHMEAFNGYSIFFISSAAMPEIENFSRVYKLNTYENLVFGQTTVQNVLNTLGPIPAPSVFIYSNEGKLVSSFNGEVDIKEITASL